MAAEEDQALADEPVERVRAILERIVDELDLDGERRGVRGARTRSSAGSTGEDLGLLIGRRGQTIDAVQLLCYRAAFRGRPDRKRVSVDAAGYRERRREAVERQADRAAERALESGKEIELEPMTPTERRVVHQHLKERAGIETFSEGDGARALRVVAPLRRAIDQRPSRAPTTSTPQPRAAPRGRASTLLAGRSRARRAASATPRTRGASTSPTP